MFYFFERASEYVRCELRPTAKGQAVDLLITESHQPERVERFADATAAAERWRELKLRFLQDGWSGPFGRD
jgi:hypothetical protein